MRDVERSVRRYRQFLERFPAHQSLILQPDEQAEHYREAAIRDELLLERVRTVLRAAGVSSYRWLEYFNLARRLDRLARLYSGRSLELAADLAIALALNRGLDAAAVVAVNEVVHGADDLARGSAGRARHLDQSRPWPPLWGRSRPGASD